MIPTSPETLESFGFIGVLDTSCEVLESITIANQSKLLSEFIREEGFAYACMRVLTESKGYYLAMSMISIIALL